MSIPKDLDKEFMVVQNDLNYSKDMLKISKKKYPKEPFINFFTNSVDQFCIFPSHITKFFFDHT